MLKKSNWIMQKLKKVAQFVSVRLTRLITIVVKLDLKTAIMVGTLLFAFAGFYYTTISDINVLSLKIDGLESENRMQQRRIDSLDKKPIV